jgi:hypothetical protein
MENTENLHFFTVNKISRYFDNSNGLTSLVVHKLDYLDHQPEKTWRDEQRIQ